MPVLNNTNSASLSTDGPSSPNRLSSPTSVSPFSHFNHSSIPTNHKSHKNQNLK